MWIKLNRKSFLLVSTVLVLIHFITKYRLKLGLCDSYLSECNQYGYQLFIYTFIFIFMFLLSLITFFLKEKVARSWRFFSIWAVFLSLVLITFLPTYTHGLDFVPLTKGTGILMLSTLYAFISLILIIFKSIQLRNKN